MEASQGCPTESKTELNTLNNRLGEGEEPELPWGASLGFHENLLWADFQHDAATRPGLFVVKIEMTRAENILGRKQGKVRRERGRSPLALVPGSPPCIWDRPTGVEAWASPGRPRPAALRDDLWGLQRS